LLANVGSTAAFISGPAIPQSGHGDLAAFATGCRVGEHDIGLLGHRHVMTLLAARLMQPIPNRKIGNHRGHDVR
jgi:hypothetical protein